ncbi:MAG TPA: DUF2911 domain-containing protein [Longimicrobiales bacterium]
MLARHIRLLLATLLLSACTGGADAETYGFVATLGDDTTSVERVTRDGDRITGDAVGRSPLVVRRRWETTLAPDGSVRTWTMDTEMPNAPAGQTRLHHELEVRDGVVRVTRHTGADSVSRTFAAGAAPIVPWNAFLYATFESLIDAAARLPDTTRLPIYFFEGWEEGRVGSARVRALDDGTLGISSSGLSGEGVARVDESGRLVAYSGAGTTYKQEVRRVTELPELDSIFARFAAAERDAGVARVLSARDTMRARVHGVDVSVDYGRPLLRGRTLLGELIPYDRVWRTGANAATHVTLSGPLSIGDIALGPGTYTLWTLPTRAGVQLVVNAQTGQWGTGYGARHDIARVPMQVDSVAAPVEQFTIRIDDAGPRLVMEWGTFRWSVPIEAR